MIESWPKHDHDATASLNLSHATEGTFEIEPMTFGARLTIR